MDFKKFQDFIKEQDAFFKSIDSTITEREHILFRTIKVGEEYGELCDAVIAKVGTQRKNKSDKYEEDALESEFADVVITTFMLAQAMGIDVIPALETKMKKIKEKYNSQMKKD